MTKTLFYATQIRRGMVYLYDRAPDTDKEDIDVEVTTTTDIWRGVLLRTVNPLWANITWKLKVSPNIYYLWRFFTYFDLSEVRGGGGGK